MNPGAVEEGAKVASGVVEALRSQPIALALIVMNIIFVVAVGLGAHALNIRTTQRYEAQDVLIHKLIDQCHIGGRSSFLPPLPLPDPREHDDENRHQ